MTNNNITMIKITKKTRDKIKSYKIIPRESYDDAINRVLDNFETHEKTKGDQE